MLLPWDLLRLNWLPLRRGLLKRGPLLRGMLVLEPVSLLAGIASLVLVRLLRCLWRRILRRLLLLCRCSAQSVNLL